MGFLIVQNLNVEQFMRVFISGYWSVALSFLCKVRSIIYCEEMTLKVELRLLHVGTVLKSVVVLCLRSLPSSLIHHQTLVLKFRLP